MGVLRRPHSCDQYELDTVLEYADKRKDQKRQKAHNVAEAIQKVLEPLKNQEVERIMKLGIVRYSPGFVIL